MSTNNLGLFEKSLQVQIFVIPNKIKEGREYYFFCIDILHSTGLQFLQTETKLQTWFTQGHQTYRRSAIAKTGKPRAVVVAAALGDRWRGTARCRLEPSVRQGASDSVIGAYEEHQQGVSRNVLGPTSRAVAAAD